MKRSFLFITCEEAHHICDKQQYGEAKPWERVKLAIRLSWCQITRAYTKKNRALTKAIQDANLRMLSKNEHRDMEVQFTMQLRNQDQ